jgi:LysR family pca operon transcriptional activator
MEQLREREFDFVLCRHLDPAQMAGLSFEYLFADPLVAVVRAGHPLLDASHKANPEIRQFTAVLPPKTSLNRRAAAPLAMALWLGPIIDYIESLSISFGRIYALSSDAIWFATCSSVKLDVESGAFVRLLPIDKSGDHSVGLMANSIGLIMRSNSQPTAETQILVSAIRDCAVLRRAEIF